MYHTNFRGLVQDAIVSSTNQKSNKRVKNEQEFYDYEVYSPVRPNPTSLDVGVWHTESAEAAMAEPCIELLYKRHKQDVMLTHSLHSAGY